MALRVKKYNYYIFDWDGTLANTLEVWFQAYLKLFESYGIKATYHDIATKAYGDPKGSLNFGINDYEGFNGKLFNLVKRDYAKASLYPWVENTLERIHNDMNSQICIFSSTEKAMIMKGLKYQKLLKYTDFVIGREDVTRLKPDPQGIALALEKNKVDKARAVIVGDSDKDINAGKNSGIDTVLFMPKKNLQYINGEAFKGLKPTFTIDSLPQLLN